MQIRYLLGNTLQYLEILWCWKIQNRIIRKISSLNHKKEAEAQKFCRKKKDPIQDAISDPENFHRFQSKVEKMLG